MCLPPPCADRSTRAGVPGWSATCRTASMPPLLCPITTGAGNPRAARRGAVVLDALVRELERAALGGAAVARAEDVVPAAIERKARQAELHENRRQEAQRADIEVHGVAVKQQRRARGLALGLVVQAVERDRIGGDGDELGAHAATSGGSGAAARSPAALDRSAA